MRFFPSPFGKRASDGDADSATDTTDPRYGPKFQGGPVARPIITNNPYDKGDVRRIAKGEPERSKQEILDAVHGRGQSKRTKLPKVNQAVSFIRDEWGDPEPATILAVQDVTQVVDDTGGLNGLRTRLPGEPPDPNFLINGGNDPMPLVLLVTADGLYTWTRESRVRGACGWTP